MITAMWGRRRRSVSVQLQRNRGILTNRTYNLGVLFVDEAHSGLTHDFFASVLESFKVRAESKGYDITFVNGNASNRRMSYYEHCRYRGVDGVVFA